MGCGFKFRVRVGIGFRSGLDQGEVLALGMGEVSVRVNASVRVGFEFGVRFGFAVRFWVGSR